MRKKFYTYATTLISNLVFSRKLHTKRAYHPIFNRFLFNKWWFDRKTLFLINGHLTIFFIWPKVFFGNMQCLNNQSLTFQMSSSPPSAILNEFFVKCILVYKIKVYLERKYFCMVPGSDEESWANKVNYTMKWFCIEKKISV
jgi:hypothetical protein